MRPRSAVGDCFSCDEGGRIGGKSRNFEFSGRARKGDEKFYERARRGRPAAGLNCIN